MAEQDTTTRPKKTLTLSKDTSARKSGGATGQVRQSFSHGRSKTVTVEVKRRREIVRPGSTPKAAAPSVPKAQTPDIPAGMTKEEWENRMALGRRASQSQWDITPDAPASSSNEISFGARIVTPPPAPEPPITEQEDVLIPEIGIDKLSSKVKGKSHINTKDIDAEEDEESLTKKDSKKIVSSARKGLAPKRREGRLSIQKVLAEGLLEEEEDPLIADDPLQEMPLAPTPPPRPMMRKKAKKQVFTPPKQVIREVIVPEAITVQELANRMAVRAAELIKALMKEGIMVTINQPIEADIAQLLVEQYGHTVKLVSESDLEDDLGGAPDQPGDLRPRPPVVTIMGHVDHGKTSLLDVLRETDVVSKEAGGITQHIGAYQVQLPSKQKITFIDTPGHAAFSEMRARGARVTDIVIIVVAANDGIKEQTVEAINHIKAAGVPMIVAINKIDLPDANPNQVRNELLNHDIVVEDLGGDTLCVEVSAKNKLNLDKLEEAILLQAEILELKANPNRPGQGSVVEAQMQHGLGPVATILIERGTLKTGDIFVVGTQWGRVRMLINDKGQKQKQAIPAEPIQVIGCNGIAEAGETLHVVASESKAREIVDFRIEQQKKKALAQAGPKATADTFFAQTGPKEELAIIIRGDVHGSVEAIQASLQKLSTDEASVKVLHTGVGAINESDVILAHASKAVIIGFNVRANPQAKKLAERDKVPMRYYSIIYNVIDDVRALLTGLLAPDIHEEYIGQAEIRNVFNITKAGKVAGCMITDGMVKRGAKVRLLRDNVVIHEGPLKTLKRFKDEVKEVRQGYECGMAFENYQDIRVGDIIECFEIKEVARTL